MRIRRYISTRSSNRARLYTHQDCNLISDSADFNTGSKAVKHLIATCQSFVYNWKADLIDDRLALVSSDTVWSAFHRAMSSSTKQRHVFETVRRRIQSGDFKPGERIPSDSELVREFGVSRPTVAKALQELEQHGLVRRRAGSGTYVLNMNKDGLQFGLLIPGLGTTEIFEPICAEIAASAHREGHSLVWGAVTRDQADDMGELALELCQRYVKDRVSGVFFAPLDSVPNADATNQRIIARLDQAGIPVVLLDADYLPYPERSNYDLLGIDNRRVGYLITHHLFQRGCHTVVFVAHPGAACDARIAGFIEAVVKDAGTFDSKLVARIDSSSGQAVSDMLATLKPDGIACVNDLTAGEIMLNLDRLGVDVPGDVLVAGIDDVKYAGLLRVPLTSVRQPCKAIGHAAFNAMIERVEFPDAPPRDILLGCELIERQSTQR